METTNAGVSDDSPLGTLLCDLTECHTAILERSLPHIAHLIATIRQDESCMPCQDIAAGFRAFCDLLEKHIKTEDGSVFNLIKSLEDAERLHVFHCRSIARPIGVMVEEHKSLATALDELRGLAAGYPPGYGPQGAVAELQSALACLDTDLRGCSDKEEQVVYPKAIAREALLASRE
jgi:iron-sulfur cluster repair protein YtfE (RIC family)